MAVTLAPDDSVLIVTFEKNGLKNKTLKRVRECIIYMDLDMDLREHLYSVEELAEVKNPTGQMKKILDLCRKREASYFRFAKM